MKKQFTYLPYAGVGGYAYWSCIGEDEPIAAEVAELLAARSFRLYNDACGGKYAQSPAAVAEAIARCDGAVVFLSEKSIDSLAFRNAINYLLSLRKPLVCVKLGDFKLEHGLAVQLANIASVPYTTAEETAEALVQSGVLTQDMVGAGMEKRDFNRKRNYIMLAMVALAVTIFALSALLTVQKHRSPAYTLRDADGSDYVNIASYGDEGLTAMAGKTVGELDLTDGVFTSLAAAKDVSAATVNVSGVSAEVALWPLTQVQGIKTVKISQDQVIYAGDLCRAGLTVVVTR